MDGMAIDAISHFHVYRGTTPDFTPGLLNLIQRPTATRCVDRPQLHNGGWINNRVEPDTTYYYRVSAVDRWNNEGSASPAVSAATMGARNSLALSSVAMVRRALWVGGCPQY